MRNSCGQGKKSLTLFTSERNIAQYCWSIDWTCDLIIFIGIEVLAIIALFVQIILCVVVTSGILEAKVLLDRLTKTGPIVMDMVIFRTIFFKLLFFHLSTLLYLHFAY